jgi:ATP-dependent Clp protease adaptor protein ClpS
LWSIDGLNDVRKFSGARFPRYPQRLRVFSRGSAMEAGAEAVALARMAGDGAALSTSCLSVGRATARSRRRPIPPVLLIGQGRALQLCLALAEGPSSQPLRAEFPWARQADLFLPAECPVVDRAFRFFWQRGRAGRPSKLLTRANEAPKLCAEELCGTGMAKDARRRDEGRTGTGTAVVTKTRPKTKRPNLYRVLLLNDDYTPMEFVVHVIMRFFGKSQDDATRIMLHVHNHGVGECGIFTYEVAETKVTQVMDFARKHQHPLQCVMEKT